MANIYVESFFGGSTGLGQIVAEIGMTSNYGTIMAISGDLVEVGSGTDQTQSMMYNYQLCIASGAAMERYSWPTGVNCFPSSRYYTWPNGNLFNLPAATGGNFSNGTNTFTSWGRRNDD
jgi:hypothetical protein